MKKKKKWWDKEVSDNFYDSMFLGFILFLFGIGVFGLIGLLTSVCMAA